jgi:hypothetical protein
MNGYREQLLGGNIEMHYFSYLLRSNHPFHFPHLREVCDFCGRIVVSVSNFVPINPSHF